MRAGCRGSGDPITPALPGPYPFTPSSATVWLPPMTAAPCALPAPRRSFEYGPEAPIFAACALRLSTASTYGVRFVPSPSPSPPSPSSCTVDMAALRRRPWRCAAAAVIAVVVVVVVVVCAADAERRRGRSGVPRSRCHCWGWWAGAKCWVLRRLYRACPAALTHDLARGGGGGGCSANCRCGCGCDCGRRDPLRSWKA